MYIESVSTGLSFSLTEIHDLISSYLILSYLILSYLILSYLILPYLILFYLILSLSYLYLISISSLSYLYLIAILSLSYLSILSLSYLYLISILSLSYPYLISILSLSLFYLYLISILSLSLSYLYLISILSLSYLYLISPNKTDDEQRLNANHIKNNDILINTSQSEIKFLREEVASKNTNTIIEIILNRNTLNDTTKKNINDGSSSSDMQRNNIEVNDNDTSIVINKDIKNYYMVTNKKSNKKRSMCILSDSMTKDIDTHEMRR